MRCLLATLGKDAPGVNAAVRAAARLALRSGEEVYGSHRGFLGIRDQQFTKLHEDAVGHTLARGGSLLGSSDFRVAEDDQETLDALGRNLCEFDLVVATGGLGSFALLNRVYTTCDLGLTTTMFIPASVENEFLNPDHAHDPAALHAEALGADTAANTAIQAIDRLRDQSYMTRTVFLVECIGTKSNYQPIQIGVTCGAHRVYLPKYPLLSEEARDQVRQLYGENFDPNRVDVEEFQQWIEQMFADRERNYYYLMVIIPKGCSIGVESDVASDAVYKDIVDSRSKPAVASFRLAGQLEKHFAETGSDTQVRYVVIDDLQLGGAPTARDRMLGSLYGEAAIEEARAIFNAGEIGKEGHIYLLASEATSTLAWRCYPAEAVTELFEGKEPRAGGLDSLPYFRQMRGSVSGFLPWAE